MTPHLNVFFAAAHQRDLERAAGCCEPDAEHRRALRRSLRRRLTARRARAH